MPLTDEQAEDLYRMVRELHTALVKRPASRPSVGDVTAKAAHDPSNPVVKILPKNWNGEDLRGRRYSDCPPAFLGMLSHMLDTYADRNEQKGELRYARWDRENAETARRWRATLDPSKQATPPLTDAEMDVAF